ncbi:MAG: hypothetical protein JXQ69_00940 [Paludibacteraceae bacterium]|nr:hypothetical protein [Paludibacteraceae bacterium]MBN2786863.1 hypothetical protein [Paludibacteraceae bacterium]
MQTLSIKTHRAVSIYIQPHFFILNKGNNSGKPLLQSCPNCFVILCNNEEDKEQLYWLVMGLWQSKAFYPYLKGSVIPFVTISDVKQCVFKGSEHAKSDLEAFNSSVRQLHKLEQLELNYKQNLLLIHEAKRMLFYRYMRK